MRPPNEAASVAAIASLARPAYQPLELAIIAGLTTADRTYLGAEWGGTGFNFEHSRARFDPST